MVSAANIGNAQGNIKTRSQSADIHSSATLLRQKSTILHGANTAVKWCAVPLSEVIDRGHRLEAGVFDVEAKQARALIAGGKYSPVFLTGQHGLAKEAYYPGRFKRIYTDSLHGIPFFLPSQMTDIYPKPEKYISAITKCPIDELKVKAETLLMTRSGTIGTVAYTSKTLEGKIFSDDVIRIAFKNSIDCGYVYAYLKTKIGSTILKTNGYGSVITHLEPEHLAKIPIPDAPESLKAEIHDRIARSYELRDESNELIDEATNLLIKELQLPPLHQLNRQSAEIPTVETFRIKLSDLDGRADASYHHPLMDVIVQHLHEHAAEVTTVGDSRISRDVILPGRFKRVYVEEEHGIRFLGGKEINQLNPCTEKYLSKREHAKQLETSLGIREHSILTPARGSLGSVTLPCKHFLTWAISDNMMQILSNPKICGYLYIFLNSTYGSLLMKKYTYGGVVDAIEPEHIRQVPIPLLKSPDIQTRINDLALTANDKRYEAFLLEQEAIDMMNEQVIFA